MRISTVSASASVQSGGYDADYEAHTWEGTYCVYDGHQAIYLDPREQSQVEIPKALAMELSTQDAQYFNCFCERHDGNDVQYWVELPSDDDYKRLSGSKSVDKSETRDSMPQWEGL